MSGSGLKQICRSMLPVVILCAVLAGTRPAFADVPISWVFVYAPFTVALWATIFGIFLEGAFLWAFLGVIWYRAFAGAVVANAASALVGAIPVLFIGWHIERFLRFDWRMMGYEPTTRMLMGLAIGQILVPAINTAIEMPILVLFGVRWQWRSAMVIYAANFLSVFVLLAAGQTRAL